MARARGPQAVSRHWLSTCHCPVSPRGAHSESDAALDAGSGPARGGPRPARRLRRLGPHLRRTTRGVEQRQRAPRTPLHALARHTPPAWARSRRLPAAGLPIEARPGPLPGPAAHHSAAPAHTARSIPPGRAGPSSLGLAGPGRRGPRPGGRRIGCRLQSAGGAGAGGGQAGGRGQRGWGGGGGESGGGGALSGGSDGSEPSDPSQPIRAIRSESADPGQPIRVSRSESVDPSQPIRVSRGGGGG